MTPTPLSINVRKHPRQARSAATVETILEAAARILETKGLGGFTTNAIAEKAGVSVGSLYQYFPTKEAVLTMLIRRKREALIAALESARAEARHCELQSMIDGFTRAALAHQLERPKLIQCLEYAEMTLPIDTETESLKRSIISIVADALKTHGIAEPETTARDLSALVRGLADASGVFGEPHLASLDHRVRRAVYGYLGIG